MVLIWYHFDLEWSVTSDWHQSLESLLNHRERVGMMDPFTNQTSHSNHRTGHLLLGKLCPSTSNKIYCLLQNRINFIYGIVWFVICYTSTDWSLLVWMEPLSKFSRGKFAGNFAATNFCYVWVWIFLFLSCYLLEKIHPYFSNEELENKW